MSLFYYLLFKILLLVKKRIIHDKASSRHYITLLKPYEANIIKNKLTLEQENIGNLSCSINSNQIKHNRRH